MKCPNCGEEMQDYYVLNKKNKKNTYIKVGTYCGFCKIYYNGISCGWIMPEYLYPTEKQMKTKYFIESKGLGQNEQCVTKKQFRIFISHYFEKAKKIVLKSKEVNQTNIDDEDIEEEDMTKILEDLFL